jgi:F0F1-type ATP synthase assembly protein I
MAEKSKKTSRQNSSPPEKESEMANITRSYQKGWAYSEVALQFGIAIVLCTLVGHWLDGKFETGNILMISGVMIGTVAGFIGLLKQLNVLNTKGKDERNKKV